MGAIEGVDMEQWGNVRVRLRWWWRSFGWISVWQHGREQQAWCWLSWCCELFWSKNKYELSVWQSYSDRSRLLRQLLNWLPRFLDLWLQICLYDMVKNLGDCFVKCFSASLLCSAKGLVWKPSQCTSWSDCHCGLVSSRHRCKYENRYHICLPQVQGVSEMTCPVNGSDSGTYWLW